MSKESTSGNVDYDLSRFEPLISLVKNTSKQLPEIENFPLESEQPLTIQDVIDKKVVNLDKLLPLAQNGSFDRTAFMQMVKDVPYTIKPKEQHLKTRDGKVYDMPFKSNFIRSTSTTSYNELTYTDINNNVCSLVKMPYDTGYIDGLYLMTTSPQQLEDCTFFSFDGRNFLNVFENYVLELPSSSS